MNTTTHHAHFRLVTLTLVVLGVLLMAQVGMAQAGPEEDYDVSILTPHTAPALTSNPAFESQGAEIVVRVRTMQGEPAHGVPVRFQLHPVWQNDATIVPQQTVTEHGIARATLQTAFIGNVPITVRVGFGTVIKHTGIAFYLNGESETTAD